jgi:hypothetical protein
MVWILIFRSPTLLESLDGHYLRSWVHQSFFLTHWPLKTFSADFLDLGVDYIAGPADDGLPELVGHTW